VQKYILPALFFLMTAAAPAKASNWLECEGRATVTAAAQGGDGLWQLSANSTEATITNGFGAIGRNCAEAKGNVTISSKEEIAIGETIDFKYSYYGGMGAYGPITSRKWEHAE
jgi:hypothetical protein